jgi:hypothetical protein
MPVDAATVDPTALPSGSAASPGHAGLVDRAVPLADASVADAPSIVDVIDAALPLHRPPTAGSKQSPPSSRRSHDKPIAPVAPPFRPGD